MLWVVLLKVELLSQTVYLKVQDAVIYSGVSQTSLRICVFSEIKNQEKDRMATAGKISRHFCILIIMV